MTWRVLVVSCWLFGLAGLAAGQTATVRGFITDAETAEAMEGVNVILDDEIGGLHGTVSDTDGIYALSRIPPGIYLFQVSFIGYQTYVDTLSLRAGQTK